MFVAVWPVTSTVPVEARVADGVDEVLGRLRGRAAGRGDRDQREVLAFDDLGGRDGGDVGQRREVLGRRLGVAALGRRSSAGRWRRRRSPRRRGRRPGARWSPGWRVPSLGRPRRTSSAGIGQRAERDDHQAGGDHRTAHDDARPSGRRGSAWRRARARRRRSCRAPSGVPPKASSAGTSVRLASTATAIAPAAAMPIWARNGVPVISRATSAIMTVEPAKTTALPAVPVASAIESSMRHPVPDLRAVAREDEERVVDADREAEHGRQRGRGRREVGHAAGEHDAEHADADAEERGQQRQAGGQQRAEGDGEHDHGHEHAEHLADRRLALDRGGRAAVLDLRGGAGSRRPRSRRSAARRPPSAGPRTAGRCRRSGRPWRPRRSGTGRRPTPRRRRRPERLHGLLDRRLVELLDPSGRRTRRARWRRRRWTAAPRRSISSIARCDSVPGTLNSSANVPLKAIASPASATSASSQPPRTSRRRRTAKDPRRCRSEAMVVRVLRVSSCVIEQEYIVMQRYQVMCPCYRRHRALP